ncbi:hypothetical protein E2C01_033952 [Portunus trituberculatus]|uniref:Uncharacterized protein n=1 Tax=Portunus trituberculatus TaxID=210409 RepID=A0A5B7F4B9_PORTR|nr:hypothetical protein [Portunus trituberculatus]
MKTNSIKVDQPVSRGHLEEGSVSPLKPTRLPLRPGKRVEVQWRREELSCSMDRTEWFGDDNRRVVVAMVVVVVVVVVVEVVEVVVVEVDVMVVVVVMEGMKMMIGKIIMIAKC